MKHCKAWFAASVAVLTLAGCSDKTSDSLPGPTGTGGTAGSTATGVAGSGSTSGGSSTGGGKPGTGGVGPGMGGASAGGTLSGGAGGAGGQATGGTQTGGNGGAGGTPPTTDVFGIPIFKRSKQPGYEWNSLHWGSGEPRSFEGRDPSDPTGWSIRRGNGDLMEIDGEGVLSMGGDQPRIYFQPKSGESEPFFRDIEFTGYYRRTADDGASNAGFSVGIRAHVNGHGSVDHCLASTYYLIFRNSGTWIFDKELDHPADSPGFGGSLFSEEGAIPVGKWIGMKFLAYNLPGDNAVKLEAYIDSESDGDGTELADWRKLGETIDDGDWEAPVGDCGYPDSTVITEGGGVVFIRNTDVSEVQYKKVTWREIVNEPAETP